MKRLVELLHSVALLEKVALFHSRATRKAEARQRELIHILPDGNIVIEEINPILVRTSDQE